MNTPDTFPVVVGPDPLLDPAGVDDTNPLDTVDPAWGLPAAHPDNPARVVDQAARRTTVCPSCDGTGFVITHEDGGAGYRPCYRCPDKEAVA